MRSIGESYLSAIGESYAVEKQNESMAGKLEGTFWSRLRDALAELKLPSTQNAVATKLGVKQPSISDWNKPGGFPEAATAVEAALYAKVCVDWLYTGREPKRPAPADPIGQRLNNLWPLLDDGQRGELLGRALEMTGATAREKNPGRRRSV